MFKGLLSRIQIFLIYERKNVLKIIRVDFLFKMLHILSFSSSKFEFLNMHIYSAIFRAICVTSKVSIVQ